MASSFDEDVKRYIEKQRITEVLYLYCRGMDRSDVKILESVYWPDAYDDHAGLYEGGVPGLLDYLIETAKDLRTLHSLSNILITFDSETRARSECHGYTYHQIARPGGARTDLIGGARYLDVFEKRGDEWRIIWRRVIVDYVQTFDFSETNFALGTVPIQSGHAPDDPLYAHLAGSYYPLANEPA